MRIPRRNAPVARLSALDTQASAESGHGAQASPRIRRSVLTIAQARGINLASLRPKKSAYDKLALAAAMKDATSVSLDFEIRPLPDRLVSGRKWRCLLRCGLRGDAVRNDAEFLPQADDPAVRANYEARGHLADQLLVAFGADFAAHGIRAVQLRVVFDQ
jgi:hypothetical protein